MTRPNNPNSERILVLAPQGRDAAVAIGLLAHADLRPVQIDSLPVLCDTLMEVAGVVLIAEEAVRTADLSRLKQWLSEQPPWSDMPFVLLTRHGGGIERNPFATRLLSTLGNVTFLERPFHPTTLVSLVQAALRGRRRQYEARDRLDALRLSEERLWQLNETLEQRVVQEVGERTATEEALRQSQKMEVVGQLTGGVAHDFNNLLTIIRSSVDLLRRPGLTEERRVRYMDAVSDTVDRAAKLTSQLLAFARRQTLKPQLFDVSERLNAVADMIDTVTGARIKVVTQLSDTACVVEADVSQFETALVNMAVNARDAMDGEGSLTLCLDAGRSMPPIRGHAGSDGTFAVISLTDTGSGIAADKLSQIFDPFFTTKEVGKGTGLGLSQVIGFAKQSGGDVEVESALGCGTTFRLYLPQTAGAYVNKSVVSAEGPDVGGEGKRVLIVEDNIEVGSFASQILEDIGYIPTLSTNAEDALNLLAAGKNFDIVFSDVVMPGMGGIELAKRLREDWPQIPMVLASGYSHVLAQEGVHGFELLNKPYSADQLSRTLRRVIQEYAVLKARVSQPN